MEDKAAMRVCYIGDAVVAAGFALAGARVYSPPREPEAVWTLLERERGVNDLLIIDADVATVIASRLVDLLAVHPVPPVLVMPSPIRAQQYVDPSTVAAHRALGLP
jgi:vacuolar-type H+-ATPase subunit F/Vma7